MFNKEGNKLIKLNFRNLFKNKLYAIGGLLVFAVAVFFIVFYVGIYKYSWEDGFTRKVAAVIPYSAEKVGKANVTYSEYLSKLDPLINYHKNVKNVDFNSDEGKKKTKELKDTVLKQLAEEVVISKEAKNSNVSVSDKDLEDSFNDLVKTNGGEEKVKENLDKYYGGMSIAEFKIQYKLKMLRAKLAEKITQDESISAEAKKKADEVLTQLKNGGNFSDLAKKFSQDTSAASGGDLGFFGKGKMVPEFEKAAFALEKGKTSEIIKTVYGYHIIMVTDKKGDEIKASHILIKTKDFNEWLDEKIKEYGVKRKIKI